METRTKVAIGFTLFGIGWWAINQKAKVKLSFIPPTTTPPAPAMVTYTMSVSGVILKGAKPLDDLEQTVLEKDGYTFVIDNDGEYITFWIKRTGDPPNKALLTEGWAIPEELLQPIQT